ncbi:hypothetical protein MMC18_006839 [Xylographa bjoerkii]|nr:hypothetical protein [Xylographa bjoerkii]
MPLPSSNFEPNASAQDNASKTDDSNANMLNSMEEVNVSQWEASAEAAGSRRQKKHVAFEDKSENKPKYKSKDKSKAKDSEDDDPASLLRQHEALLKQKRRRPKTLAIVPRMSSLGRRLSDADGEEQKPTPPPPKKAGPVSWRDLPQKRQLFILTMARLSEPITQTSLQAYMFYQLKSFDPSLPPSTIAAQAGILQGCFTGAQFLTAMLWGRAADADWGGRKRVLLMGLFGTCISAVGFGFSRSFLQAAIFRFVGGILNGNVGVIRTMVSEIIKEKKYQSRAFLLLPMCFNIGVIIGPVLGGLLADPVGSYPSVFGENSFFGGKDGVWWMKHWPYALPNLVSAVFLFSAAAAVFFGLEETLESLCDKPDLGLRIAHSIGTLFRRLFNRRNPQYTAVHDEDIDTPGTESYDLESRTPTTPIAPATPLTPLSAARRSRQKLPFRRIFTSNVLFTLLSHFLLAFHIGTFNNLWFIFLSTPRFDPTAPFPPSHTQQSLPFNFTGGLGMPPRSVGFAMAVLGFIGITLQLAVYPRVNALLGTVRSYRTFLCLFPLTYFLTPYLAVVPSSSTPPAQASGLLVWLALGSVLFIQVLGRTFALPANTILVNNCSPHPSVLGTIHGIAQSVSSASRTVGPVLGGWLYGVGLQKGVVGGVWWGLAGMAMVGWVASGWVFEGDGHEIWLEGEKEEGVERR